MGSLIAYHCSLWESVRYIKAINTKLGGYFGKVLCGQTRVVKLRLSPTQPERSAGVYNIAQSWLYIYIIIYIYGTWYRVITSKGPYRLKYPGLFFTILKVNK